MVLLWEEAVKVQTWRTGICCGHTQVGLMWMTGYGCCSDCNALSSEVLVTELFVGSRLYSQLAETLLARQGGKKKIRGVLTHCRFTVGGCYIEDMKASASSLTLVLPVHGGQELVHDRWIMRLTVKTPKMGKKERG